MRKLYSRTGLQVLGIPLRTVTHRVERGEWQRLALGVFAEGSEPPTAMEIAVAQVIRCSGVASGQLAASLWDIDSAQLQPPFVTVPRALRKRSVRARYADLSADEVMDVGGIRCTSPLRTLTDLAACTTDITWEHALEWVLRNQYASIEQIGDRVEVLGASRTNGVARMRRVLALRPPGAPPTESLLETLMVQLIRADSRLPEPTRQFVVNNRRGEFVARVDLAWPRLGVFIELDGQHHAGQPVYDARRETAVVAATRWLPARFTWHEVTRVPIPTLRRLAEIALR